MFHAPMVHSQKIVLYREKKITKPGCRGRFGLGKTTLLGGFFFKPSLIMFVCQLLTLSLNINSCLAVRARFLSK